MKQRHDVVAVTTAAVPCRTRRGAPSVTCRFATASEANRQKAAPLVTETLVAGRPMAGDQPRRCTAGGQTPLDSAIRSGAGQPAARALTSSNTISQHSSAAGSTNLLGLLIRRSRVRIPKAAPVRPRSENSDLGLLRSRELSNNAEWARRWVRLDSLVRSGELRSGWVGDEGRGSAGQ